MELPHPLQMNIQLRKFHLLIQHFVILQLRHTTFITQSLKEIHSGRETGLIDTGPFKWLFLADKQAYMLFESILSPVFQWDMTKFPESFMDRRISVTESFPT